MDSRRQFSGQSCDRTGRDAGGRYRRDVLGANDRIRVGIDRRGRSRPGAAESDPRLPEYGSGAPSPTFTRAVWRRRQVVGPGRGNVSRLPRICWTIRSIDAVVIATPPHLHAEQFCAALDAGKHVYQEKTLGVTVDRRQAYARGIPRGRAASHVVQIGHQSCSFGQMADVQQFLSASRNGWARSAPSRCSMYRNTPRSKPQWARPALLTPDVNPKQCGIGMHFWASAD